MEGNGKRMYISAKFELKESEGNENINLEGQETEILSIIVTDIGNHGS